jgi:hypothetical protein
VLSSIGRGHQISIAPRRVRVGDRLGRDQRDRNSTSRAQVNSSRRDGIRDAPACSPCGVTTLWSATWFGGAMTVGVLGPAYRRLWSSTTLACVGEGIRMAAFPLLAAGLSARPVLVAGVAVAGQAPWLLAGLPAGALVDRVDRRRLIAVVDAAPDGVSAVLVVAIVSGHATIWAALRGGVCRWLGETLRESAAATLVPALVPTDCWERSNGLLAHFARTV